MASTRSSLEQLTSTRPKFPEGLQVLLVEGSSDQHTQQLLIDLQYNVTRVASISDAASVLHGTSVDVVLADMSLVGDITSHDAQALFIAAGQVPVLLMGAQCSSSQVLAAVQHGAADFLEQPLSQLKLRNIWQHTVRMMMHTCDIRSQPPSPTAAEAAAELMAKHDAAAAAAAAYAPLTAVGSPKQATQQRDGHPLAYDEPCHVDDCLKALELPPLMPSQVNMDPELIFLDLDTPVQPDEPNLDDILQPYTPSGSAAADEFSTDHMVTNCSSEQHGSGTTGMTAFPGELESCADTSSRMGGGGASPLGSRVAGLRSHASMRSLAAPGDWQHTAAQPAAAPATAGGAHNLLQQQQQPPMPAPGCPVYPSMPYGSWGPGLGAPTGVRGMVWGMPVYTVARAPGLAVPKSSKHSKVMDNTGSASASAASSPTHKGCTARAGASLSAAGQYTPWMMPQMCWPMMSMMGMPPAAAGPVAAAGQMQMFPGMFPGMFTQVMGPMGMPMMGMPGVPPMGVPGMWPAAATAAAATVPTPQQQLTGTAAAAAHAAPVKMAAAALPAAAAAGCDASFDSQAPAATAGADVCRVGSIDSSSLAAGDEFVSGLFLEEPRVSAGCTGQLNTDTLFSNVC